MHERVHCPDEAAKSPVAHSCGLLNHPNSFHRGIFKLNTKSDADSLLYSLSHFQWDNYTVHMLTQSYLLPPLTSTVKSSLFMHEHSSPLSLAARLPQHRVNYSRYINNGWTFSLTDLVYLSLFPYHFSTINSHTIYNVVLKEQEHLYSFVYTD